MTEYKWSIGLRHKATGEKLNLTVWAPKNDEATHKLCGVLIGPECGYEWTGTGPVYENNQRVLRLPEPVGDGLPVSSLRSGRRPAGRAV